jgi:hypothetical protein
LSDGRVVNMTRQRMLKWTAPLIFGLTACGGGGDGTGPKTDICLPGASGLLQPSFKPTLLEAEAVIDGQVVGRQQSAPATASLIPGGTKANVGEGAHTVGCRIVSQTATPTVYEITAVDNATRPGGATQDSNLGPLTKTLATGDVVTFNITVNL